MMGIPTKTIMAKRFINDKRIYIVLSIPTVKTLLQSIPFPAGVLLSHVPYSIRPCHGLIYRQRAREIHAFEDMLERDQRQYIFDRMKAITLYAWENIEFYRYYYENHNFRPSQLKGFEDLALIPSVTKSMLQQWELEKRSSLVKGRYLVNTGGSSGCTLSFYIEPSSIGHEWSHVHHAWAQLGYRQYDLKLWFVGQNLMNKPLCYDGLRHQFVINIYLDYSIVAERLRSILHKHTIRYLHGYPSAIYEFATYCDREDHELLCLLKRTLRGVFLVSEYPAPLYREKIESTFGVVSLSFYGHTERTVFATERKTRDIFSPLQTYGYAEAIPEPENGVCKLFGTSYYNTASPLIRYDTSDEIHVEEETGGILRAFKIEAGREGDFIIDSCGKRIPLTGLIFGRHHLIFNRAKFVQIAQTKPGQAVLYVTLDKFASRNVLLEEEFDTSGVNITFTYHILKKPIVTSRGKVLLKVPIQHMEKMDDNVPSKDHGQQTDECYKRSLAQTRELPDTL
ncbi:MAG: hypothetical protein GY774_27410 [Planctomycetes bacterium]|nr:hypothetical protein [Planctomycetota bacterium]